MYGVVCRAEGAGCRVQGAGCRVQDVGWGACSAPDWFSSPNQEWWFGVEVLSVRSSGPNCTNLQLGKSTGQLT